MNMMLTYVLLRDRLRFDCPYVSFSPPSNPKSNTNLLLIGQFVEFYYRTFDENRPNLAALYVRTIPLNLFPWGYKIIDTLTLPFQQRNDSMLTFEDTPCQGTEAILSKITVCLEFSSSRQ